MVGAGSVGGVERRTRCAEGGEKCEETRDGKRQTRTPFQDGWLARAAAPAGAAVSSSG